MSTDANARGPRPTLGHIRGLDGIRALSVLAVIAFHTGGIYVGLRLAPELAALGQAHATASPGGTWPGSLPPSTPSWFPNLPCQ